MPIAHTEDGRFRVVRRLGSGGAGSVVLAEDERLGRPVAIKALHAHGSEDAVRRFRREARLGASLNHPRLVKVFDVLEDPDGVRLVMEYVPGSSLADELRGGPLGPERTVRMLRDVAEALDHAHEHGVLHRDVKPGNVLLDRRGRAKLADLGVATAEQSTGETRTGAIVGTVAYAAPEVVDGHRGTRASDVYGLAAIAFEALAGRRAHPGASVLEVARSLVAGPPDLREAAPDLPRAAAAVLRRAMDRDPARRHETAGAFVDDLAAALGADAAVERRAPRPLAEEPVAVARGRRRPAGVLVAAALALLAVAVGAALLASGGGDERAATTGGATGTTSEGGAASDEGSSASGEGPGAAGEGGSGAAGEEASGGTAAGGAVPEGGSGAATAAAGEPAGAVRRFYELAAADRFDEAWALAAPDLQAAWGGSQEAFAADLRSLESITFDRLEVTEQQGDAATVQLASRARHTSYTDVCQGPIAAVRQDGGWRVGRPGFSCRRQ